MIYGCPLGRGEWLEVCYGSMECSKQVINESLYLDDGYSGTLGDINGLQSEQVIDCDQCSLKRRQYVREAARVVVGQDMYQICH